MDFLPMNDEFNAHEAKRRNDIATDALMTYFENALREDESPCLFCSNIGECRKCPWDSINRATAGLWMIRQGDAAAQAYEESSVPFSPYPSNPFKYSYKNDSFIVPSRSGVYICGTSITQIADEYEIFASMTFPYGAIGSERRHHAHSFDSVVNIMANDPENFYIPKWAGNMYYSRQEILFLEVLRERLCRDNGCAPAVDIVYDDGNDEGLLDSDESWEKRVRRRISELRGEDTECEE